jgi:uncharacterized protein (TIGR00725 family)
MILIGVIGSGTCGNDIRQLAYDVGKGIAEADYPLICGGLGGVMEGACQGAFDAGGLTIGLLPGTDPGEANPYVIIPIATGLGYARNAIIARASGVLIAIEGGPGTLSEIAFGLQFGVPVIGLSSFDVSSDMIQVASAGEAVDTAINVLK